MQTCAWARGQAAATARPQQPAPDADSGEAERTARPLSRNGTCYAVRGGGESSSSRWKHLEAQSAAVRAHTVICAEDAEIGQRLSQEKGAGEVKRVERSDGLHGKRSLRAFGDLSRQLENRRTGPGLGDHLQHGGAAHLVEQLLRDGGLLTRRVSTMVSREQTTLVASRRSR